MTESASEIVGRGVESEIDTRMGVNRFMAVAYSQSPVEVQRFRLLGSWIRDKLNTQDEIVSRSFTGGSFPPEPVSADHAIRSK